MLGQIFKRLGREIVGSSMGAGSGLEGDKKQKLEGKFILFPKSKNKVENAQ